MFGVAIFAELVAKASVNCAKYVNTPQYCAGRSNFARTISSPAFGSECTLESSKNCESSGIPHAAHKPLTVSIAADIVTVSCPVQFVAGSRRLVHQDCQAACILAEKREAHLQNRKLR